MSNGREGEEKKLSIRREVSLKYVRQASSRGWPNCAKRCHVCWVSTVVVRPQASNGLIVVELSDISMPRYPNLS